ncbi:MAG: type VI secretion system tip protein TssI/VgrG [Polyangiaceae bacterium]
MSVDLTIAFRSALVPPPCLRPIAVRGHEGISTLYGFEVIVATAVPPAIFERVVLGRRASVALSARGQRRAIHGVVSAVRLDETRDPNGVWHQFTLRLVPRAWLLTKRFGSRVWQEESVDTVIAEVATALDVPVRFQLEKELPKRKYCTQFAETDFAFIARLAAENGLLFYFEQPSPGVDQALDGALDTMTELANLLPLPAEVQDGISQFGGEVMCFTDQESYPPIRTGQIQDELAARGVPLSVERALGPIRLRASVPSPSLPAYRRGGASTDEDSVTEVTRTLVVEPTVGLYREFDPRRPLHILESLDQAFARRPPTMDVRALASGSLEPLRAAADQLTEGLLERRDLEVYRHASRDLFASTERAHEEGDRILKQERRDRDVVRGSADSVRLEAGHRWALEGHDAEELNRGYVVVEADLEAFHSSYGTHEAGRVATRFVCVPEDVLYTPAAPPPRFVNLTTTGIVVGPEGEEIHVNEHGEIRVAFFWDRREQRNQASCWLRVMQSMAGPGWGTQFIPRVGMEVVVTFDGGDPDKPMVLGCVYNGITPPTFALPQGKATSGWRTKSTPNSEGHNELSFDDSAGSERVFIRAEKDFEAVVENNRTARVGNDDVRQVARDQSLAVGGRRNVRVSGDLLTEVRGDDRHHVSGSRHLDVQGNLEQVVQRARRTDVGAHDTLVVGGDTEQRFEADHTTRIRGAAAAIVGTTEAGRGATLHVEGPLSVSATGLLDISSRTEIMLRVGGSSIRIKDGDIEIVSGKVSIAGKDAKMKLDDGYAKFKVKSALEVVSDDKIVLKSSGASLGLSSEATLDGAQVLLNSPEQASVTIDVSSPEPTKIHLVDADGKDLGHERFRVVLSDGTIESGVLDGHGKAEVLIDEDAKIEFPDLSGVEAQ